MAMCSAAVNVYLGAPPLGAKGFIYIYMYLSVFCVLFFLSYSFALILSLVSSHHFSSERQNMVCRRNSTLSKVGHIFLYICLSSCTYIQQPLLPLLHLRPHFLTDRPSFVLIMQKDGTLQVKGLIVWTSKTSSRFGYPFELSTQGLSVCSLLWQFFWPCDAYW